MRAVRYMLAIAALWTSLSSGQAGLPAEVQADLLRTKILAAYVNNDWKGALTSIDAYKRLNIAMPPSMLFAEAKAAKQIGDGERAFSALAEFLKNETDRGSRQYTEALALYPAYEEGARAAQKRRSVAWVADIPNQMVSIPGGTFQMGDLAGDGDADEKPVHTVNIKSFKLGKYEVTVGQFRAFVLSTDYKTEAELNIGKEGCLILDTASGKTAWHTGASWTAPGFEQSDAHPVVCVTWNDAQAFVQWLNREGGKRFRLPSESEWEYAARAATTNKYPWGNNADQGCSHANGADQTPWPGGVRNWNAKMNCSDGFFFTSPVGRYAANSFGLFDMIGNVGEWTEDCSNNTYGNALTDGSPWLTGECSSRVARGDSWSGNPTFLRVSNRYRGGTTIRSIDIGFRLAQDL